MNIIEALKRIEQKLEKYKENRWLSLKEVIEYTSLSAATIRRAKQKGFLKVSTRTGKLLFKRSDVDNWLNG
jgi:predicted DNA-binding transcriptional regulator AlpA|tara:strand:- start:84 stop:296 length:213 start_codon:yes stop_codon:yes gene_type:complete